MSEIRTDDFNKVIGIHLEKANKNVNRVIGTSGKIYWNRGIVLKFSSVKAQWSYDSSGSTSEINVNTYYGDVISRNNNVITIYKGDSTNVRHTLTASANTGYGNLTYSTISSPITSETTITATATINTYTLSISKGTGVSTVTVKRTSSPNAGAATGELSNGASIYIGDTLTVAATAQNGYKLDSYTTSYTVGAQNISVSITATIIPYTVTFALSGSKYGSWSNATVSPVYYGDSVSASNGTVTVYQGSTTTVRGSSKFTNGSATGYTYTYSLEQVPSSITGNCTVYANSSRTVNEYTLTKTTGTGVATHVVKRTSSPNKGASTGELSSGAKIYYGDVLSVTATASTGYGLNSYTSSYTVTGNITSSLTAYRLSYTLTFTKGDYGSWSSTSTTAYYGDTISVSNNVVTIYKWDASTTVRATVTYTRNSNTDQYTYTNTLSGYSSPVTGKQTIVSKDNRYLNTYTVALALSGNYPTGASWYNNPIDQSSESSEVTAAYNINYGDSISISGSTVAFGADPDNYNYYIDYDASTSENVPYNYSYNISSNTTTVGTSTTVTCAFTRSVKSYTLTKSTGTGVATHVVSRTSSPYQGAATGELASGATIYYGDVLSVSATAETAYNLSSYTKSYTVTGNVTSTVSATRKTFTITFTKGSYGSWSSTSLTAQYGDTISRSSNTVTIYKWDSASTARASSTYTLSSSTAQYTYTNTYSTLTSPITSAQTVTSTDTRTVNKYAVTFTANSYAKNGFLSTSSTATSGSASGTTYDYGTTVYYFVTLNDNTDQYTYTDETDTSVSGRVYRVGSYTVTAAKSLGTIGTIKRTVNTYSVSLATAGTTPTSYYWTHTDEDGNVEQVTETISVPYGTAVNISGVTLTLGSYTDQYSVTYTSEAPYNFSEKLTSTSTTVVKSTTVTDTFTRTVKSYTFTLTKNANTGALSISRTKSPYQDASTGTLLSYAASDSTGSKTATIYYGDVLSGTGAAATGYNISASTYSNSGVTGNASYAPTASRISYTITFSKGTYGSWTSGSLTAYYGDVISRSNNTVSIYKWDSTSTVRSSSTYSVPSATAQYTYSITGYSTLTSPIYAAQTVSATDTRTVNKYAVTFTLGNYVKNGFLSTSSTATSGSASGTTYDYGTTVYYFITLADDTDQYYYNDIKDTLVSGRIYRVGSVSVTSAKSLGAIGNVSRNDQYYTVSLALVGAGSPSSTLPDGVTWNYRDSDGTVTSGQTATYRVPYGTIISIDGGGTLTFDGYDDDSWYTSWNAETGYDFTESVTSSSTTVVKNTTVTSTITRSAKSYTFTLTKNANIGALSISRTSSPNKGASTGTLLSFAAGDAAASKTATIYYGDVLTGTGAAATGYSISASSYSNSGVTGNASYSPTATRLTYSFTVTLQNYATAFQYSTDNTNWTTSTVSKTFSNVDYATTYYIKVSSYGTDGYQYKYTWASGGTGTYTRTYSSHANITYNQTRATRTYTVSGTSTNGSVYWATSSITTSGGSATLSANYGTTVYYRIAANAHYSLPSTYYGSYTLNETNFALSTSGLTAVKALTACTAITYTVSGGTATNGTVSWTNGVYGANSTWTISPNAYYAKPSTYTGTKAITTDNFTVSDSAKTATYSGNLGTCTAYTETIQQKTITGGTVYWSTSEITTSGGTTTLDASYASTVYWRIEASTGYNLPTTYYGSMTLNSTNFTMGSTTAASTATYKGSAISNCTRKTFTVTFTKGTYGSWTNTSLSVEYGDTISRSGNTVTIYKWDASSTARSSSTYSVPSATAQYTYSISGYSTLTSPITANQTVTATDTRTVNKYAVTFTACANAKNGFLSTSSTATSGSASGTTFDYNTTVYYFITLKDNTDQYTYTDTTDTNVSGRIYRVGSVSVTSAKALGTIGTVTQKVNNYTVSLATAGTTPTTYHWIHRDEDGNETEVTETISVPYGTSVNISGFTLTLGSYTDQYYFNYDSEAPYNFTENITSSSSTVVKNTTVTDTLSRTVKSYTFTLTKNANVGALSISRSSSPYQGASTGTLLSYASGDASGSKTATIYYGDVLSGTAGTTTGYSVSSTTYSNSGVTGSASFAPTASRLSYTITFTKGTYGSWTTTSTTAYYGDTISISGNTVTIYKWDATSTARASSTYSVPSATAQYTYSITGYSTLTSPITANQTVTASDSRTTNKYAVTFTANSLAKNGFLSTSSSATTGDASGTTYDYGTTVYYFITLPDNTAQYSYTSSNTLVSGRVYRVGSVSVTSAKALGTIGSVTRTTNTYTIGLTATGDAPASYQIIQTDPDGHESTVTDFGSHYYGTTISYSGSSVTFDDEEDYDYSIRSTNTQYYTYQCNLTGDATVTGANNITATFTRTAVQYAVTFSLGNYVKNGFLSTSSTATSGSESGTKFNYGTTVYYFITLADDTAQYYYKDTTDTLVSGRVYRVGSYTVTGTKALGTIGTVNRYPQYYTIGLTVAGNAPSSYSLIRQDSDGNEDQVSNFGSHMYGSTVEYSGSSAVFSDEEGYDYYMDWDSETIYNYTCASSGATTITGASNITETFTRSVKSYKLTITKGANVSTVTVNRTSSPYQGASTGALSSGDTIYYGDTLTVSATASSGYYINTYTSSYTVTGNVSVSITATAKTTPIVTVSSIKMTAHNTDNKTVTFTVTCSCTNRPGGYTLYIGMRDTTSGSYTYKTLNSLTGSVTFTGTSSIWGTHNWYYRIYLTPSSSYSDRYNTSAAKTGTTTTSIDSTT